MLSFSRAGAAAVLLASAAAAPPAAMLESFDRYTHEQATTRSDVLAVGAIFEAAGGSRRSLEYRVCTIPRALQESGLESAPNGRGTAAVRRTDAGAIATFRGETSDGVRVEARIACNR